LRLLRRREGDIALGKLPGIYFDKVFFDELVEAFLADYRVNGKKSLARAMRSAGHLKRFFEGARVVQITSPGIQYYTEQRLEEGAANATINRELAALKRMFNLGAQQTPPKVDRVPHIPMLKENNVREGFFEQAEYEALRDALPCYLKGFVTFAYKTGWRFSEIAGRTWSLVDLDALVVRLQAGMTKNDDARTIVLDDELAAIFRELRTKARLRKCRYVFPSHNGRGRIRDIRGAWAVACKKAKIEKRLFHDFRRTAVRNMVRSGIPEGVAMQITGHKTRAIFERYNIVSESDLKDAARKQDQFLEAQRRPAGTVIKKVALQSDQKIVDAFADDYDFDGLHLQGDASHGDEVVTKRPLS